MVRTVEDSLDPFQFAYSSKKRVDDAVLTLLNLLCRHLDCPGTHTHLLFLDFSSAFNTIQPHILANKLLSYFKLCPGIVGWILDFVVDWSQFVRVNGFVSDVLFPSTFTSCTLKFPTGKTHSEVRRRYSYSESITGKAHSTRPSGGWFYRVVGQLLFKIKCQ